MNFDRFQIATWTVDDICLCFCPFVGFIVFFWRKALYIVCVLSYLQLLQEWEAFWLMSFPRFRKSKCAKDLVCSVLWFQVQSFNRAVTDSCDDWNSTTMMCQGYAWGFAKCMGFFQDTVQEYASKLSTAHWNTACSGCQEDGHWRSTCAIKDSWMFSQVTLLSKKGTPEKRIDG